MPNTNEAHADQVHAALTRYTALVTAESKDTEAWQAVGFELEALLDDLTGGAREVVRARAVDALQTARLLIRTGGN